MPGDRDLPAPGPEQQPGGLGRVGPCGLDAVLAHVPVLPAQAGHVRLDIVAQREAARAGVEGVRLPAPAAEHVLVAFAQVDGAAALGAAVRVPQW